MQIRTLRFIVNGQQIKKDPKCDFNKIVRGTSGYLKAGFSLSNEWIGCRIAASFWCLGKEYPAVLNRNECFIPKEALIWSNFEVSLTGIKDNYKITTNKIRIVQED